MVGRLRALDLFCRAGGVTEGLLRAGFDVVSVDILDCSKAFNRGPGNPERHERPAVFVQADALTYPLEGFDFIWASPPCQAHSVLRKLRPDKEYPDLIPATRERLMARGIPWVIENVPGAPLLGWPLMLCGSMFGLQTTDGRAELRRHRIFETSWPISLRPSSPVDNRGRKVLCVAGGKAMSGGMMTPQGELKRRACGGVIGVYGGKGQERTQRLGHRETFSTDDARAAMGIDWMAMKDLSQAIPPIYSEFIGRLFLGREPERILIGGGQATLF